MMLKKILWFGYALSALLFVYVGLKMMFVAKESITPKEDSEGIEEIKGLVFLGFVVTSLAIASISMNLNERE
jgi:hypothetical protein